jgi:hypothetical protein
MHLIQHYMDSVLCNYLFKIHANEGSRRRTLGFRFSCKSIFILLEPNNVGTFVYQKIMLALSYGRFEAIHMR